MPLAGCGRIAHSASPEARDAQTPLGRLQVRAHMGGLRAGLYFFCWSATPLLAHVNVQAPLSYLPEETLELAIKPAARVQAHEASTSIMLTMTLCGCINSCSGRPWWLSSAPEPFGSPNIRARMWQLSPALSFTSPILSQLSCFEPETLGELIDAKGGTTAKTILLLRRTNACEHVCTHAHSSRRPRTSSCAS